MSNRIIKCLVEKGYRKLTDLQKKAFETIYREQKTIIIVAPTGTGKTEAAVFPILYYIWRHRAKPIAALYITPLRALNRDIEERLRRIASCFNLKVSLRHGDTPYSRRKNLVKDPPHLLVTTPETLNYLIINPQTRRHFKNLRFIVVDEYREILESKRGLQLLLNIYMLEKYLQISTIKVALTATLQDIDNASLLLDPGKKASILVDDSLKKLHIEIKMPVGDNLTESREFEISDKDLISRIIYIVEELGRRKRVLIFTNTRSIAERLGALINNVSRLLDKEVMVEVHHGSLSRKHRVFVEEKFKRGEIKGLVATSSMELGIDIGYVDYVIQYMSPRQVIRLVQRIGRSGHKLGGIARGSIVIGKNLLQILESYTIADYAIQRLYEKENIIWQPLDILAYTIVVYAIVNDKLDINELYKLVVEYPLYRTLDKELFMKVIDYLCYSRILRCRDNEVYPTGRSKLYVYLHTMIPDERDIMVVETSTKKNVGVLNEEYIVLYTSPGDIIILGGKPWRIIQYDEENGKLYVEKLDEYNEAMIPHWEGENIPVPYIVAEKVGERLGNIRSFRDEVDRKKQLLVDPNVLRYIDNLRKLNDVPSNKKITIYVDKNNNLLIIIVFGGSKLNRLLRDIFVYFTRQHYPFYDVKGYVTPYSIILHVRKGVVDRDLIEFIISIIKNLDRLVEDQFFLKRISLENGTLLWRIYQVAQRFGAINIRREQISRRILEAFVDTVIGDEAFNEVIHKDYDLGSLHELIERIKEKQVEINVKDINDNREIVSEFLEYLGSIHPNVEKPLDKDKYLERILAREMTLICINCGYRLKAPLNKLYELDEYRCPRCKLKTLAPVKTSGELEEKIIKKYLHKERLSKDEKKILNDLRRRASLLMHYGRTALLVLASPGVGVKEAIRIINAYQQGSDIIEEIYRSERKYLQIKKYLKRIQK